jgi:transcriptional regulator with XRE-family HTH domain
MVLMKLAEAITSWRHYERLSLRDAAYRIGIDKSSLLRLEQDKPINEKNFAIVLRWLLSD